MIRPGDLVARYRIEAVLGAGGMGQVFSAIDTQLGRRVAVKVVLASESSTEGFVERAMREARAAAKLNHPNAVAVYDVGLHEGAPFVVMELVEGETLRVRMARSATIPERVRWLVETARALAAAHREGLVHRDVKPDNVMVRPDGRIKVLDFGIARAATIGLDASAPTEEQGLSTLTNPGALVGTPLYMAPEQLKREPLDGRADQYAWGVTAYQVLTGATPFGTSDAVQLIAATLGEAPPPPSAKRAEIGEETDRVILRALAKRAADRFDDMDEAANALDRSLIVSAPPAAPNAAPNAASPATSAARVAPRSGSFAAHTRTLIAVVVAATTIGVGLWLVGQKAFEPMAAFSPRLRPLRPAPPLPPAPPVGDAPAKAIAGAPPIKRHLCVDTVQKDGGADTCPKGSPNAWCDPNEKLLVCCAAGLSPNGAGTFCGCPPGGSLGHFAKRGCSAAAEDYPEQIQRVVKEHFDAIRACYTESITRREAPVDDAGRVEVAFEIDPDGQTVLPRVRGASVPDPTMQACVVAAFEALRFPPPPDGQRKVSYPLLFSVGEPGESARVPAKSKAKGKGKKSKPAKPAPDDDDDDGE